MTAVVRGNLYVIGGTGTCEYLQETGKFAMMLSLCEGLVSMWSGLGMVHVCSGLRP